MKKYMFMAVAGMLALSSCSSDDNEQTPQNTPRQMTFTAGFGDGTQTRTTLNANKSVEFDSDDAISIFSENNTNVQFTTTWGGATAEFTGTAVAGDATYYAVYPYDSYTFSGGIVSGVTIAGYQQPNIMVGETWVKSTVISYATTTGSDLEFHNACALLKITNNTGMFADIKISVSADQSLAGIFDLDTSTGALTVTDGTNSVTTFIAEDNATVYLAIAPGTYTNFTAAKSNDHGEWYSKTKASVTFQAGKIYDLGTTRDWMTQSAPAETTDVTWNSSDMSGNHDLYGGFTYDGVTLSGMGNIGDGSLNAAGGCTFYAPSNKNFTKIVISAMSTNIEGDGWSKDLENGTATWTGSASHTVSFSGMADGVTSIVFTTVPAETANPTWTFSELSGIHYLSEGYTNNGVTLQGTGDVDFDMGSLNANGESTFTAPTGKHFKSIVINATGTANISGSGWTNDMEPGNNTSTWTGDASIVSFSGTANGITSIVFTLEDE